VRTTGIRLFGLLVLAGLFGLRGAYGQIDSEVHFKMSSGFVAGSAAFPAGSYIITVDNDDPGVLQISNADHSHSVWVQAEPMQSQAAPLKTQVLFNKYGDTWVLKQVWLQGHPIGLLVPRGIPEKKAQKQGAPSQQSVPGNSK
jgi:hypothetical protein